jgi:glutathione S-transferase
VRIIQIPFSHNCLKVRKVLELKGLPYETTDISPMRRGPVIEASGQREVPVLVDGERVVTDSTAILLYIEATYPAPPLLPAQSHLRGECLLLEDWADAAFMALTRRIAYWNLLTTPEEFARLIAPRGGAVSRRVSGWLAGRMLRSRFGLSEERNRRDEAEARRLSRLAVERLAGKRYLVADKLTVADVTLAAMSVPLRRGSNELRLDPHVTGLLDWGRRILEEPRLDGAR